MGSLDKFGRNYVLTVQLDSTKSGLITITPPITLEFDITRKNYGSTNVGQIRLYNLALETRNALRFNLSDTGKFIGVVLKAGYGNNLSTIFSGNATQAWSVREGTNFITQIECLDGGFASVNGTCDIYFPAGTPLATIITAIASTLPNVSIGAIGNYGGSISRGNTYSGNSLKILKELTGGGAFIDNQKFNALGSDEFISIDKPLLINSQSGLLGTPVLEHSIARFDMIFEPQLMAGGLIILESSTETNFNGTYVTIGVKHRGMISPAVCGNAITTGDFAFLGKPKPVVSR